MATKAEAAKEAATSGTFGVLKGVYVAIGILSIMADLLTVPPAVLGTTYCGSSGASFCPLLPYKLPILAIIGVVVGLASITMAFSSGRVASAISSIAAGFALTFVSASGNWTSSSMDVGWPLAWAHQFYYLGLFQSQPWFYVDVLGLSLDVAFWAAVVFVLIGLIRVVLQKQSSPS